MKKKRFIVIWYRKWSNEWRIATEKDSSRLTLQQVDEFNRNFRLVKFQREYLRDIYQMESIA